MAIITPHTSQAGIATANGGQAAQYRSLDAFVTPGMRSNAQGLDALARGLDKFGGAVFKLGIDRMQQQNAADLLADKQAEEDAFRAFDSDFREKNKGENALSAPDAYNQFFQDRMNGLKGKWGGNKNLMNAAESMFNSIRKGGMDKAVQYRDMEQEKFVLGVGKAEEARTLLSLSDPATPPDERERLMCDYESSARMLARGRNIDADLLAFRMEARRQAKGAVMNQILERLEAGDMAGAEALRKQYAKTGISGQSGAEYTARRESGKDGSLAIAYDRNGGTSYGKFQIASKPGTMDDFIKWLGGNGGEEAAAALKAAGSANTGGKDGKMPQTWRELVQSGKITDAMQEQFIYDTHVVPVLKGLPKGLKDLAQGDATFDRVLWSTANQHGPGGAKRLISEAWGKSGGDMRAFYQNLYEARAGDFGSSTAEVRQSVLNRLRGELSDAVNPANDITNRPLFDAADVRALVKMENDIVEKQQKKADKLFGFALADVVAGGGSTIDQAKAEIEKKYGNDLMRKNLAQDALMEQISINGRMKEAEKKMERAKELSGIESAIASPGFNKQIAEDILASASPENKPRALQLATRELAKRGLISPVKEVNDPVAYQRAKQLILANTPIEEVMMEHGTSLSSLKEEELRTLAQNQAQKNAERQDNAYIDYYIKQSGIDHKAGTKGEKFIAELKMQYSDWLATPGEKNAVARESWWYEHLARRKERGNIWNTAYSPQEQAYSVAFDIPDDAKEAVSTYLKDNGQEDTDENFNRAWLKIRKSRGMRGLE